jgi:hypothetical protein
LADVAYWGPMTILERRAVGDAMGRRAALVARALLGALLLGFLSRGGLVPRAALTASVLARRRVSARSEVRKSAGCTEFTLARVSI